METTANKNNTSDGESFLTNFCGGFPFWDEEKLNQDTPIFSQCFMDTVLVWIPCAYLWIFAPFFILYLFHGKRMLPLPFSTLHLAKVVTSCLVLCTTVLHLILMVEEGYQCQDGVAIPYATYTAMFFKTATFVLAIVLKEMQRWRGMKTSGVPFCFWMFLIASEIIPLYSHMSKKMLCTEDIVYFIYFVQICVQWVLHCFAEQYNTKGSEANQNQCPDENASVLNHIFYHWLTPLVWQVYRRTFSSPTFWEQTTRLKSEFLGPLIEKEWLAEVKRCKDLRKQHKAIRSDLVNGFVSEKLTVKTPILNNDGYGRNKHNEDSDQFSPQPSLFKVLFRLFIANWFEATSFKGIAEILMLAQPMVLRYVIRLIETRKESGDGPVWKDYTYSFLLLVSLVSNTILFHISHHHIVTLGLKVKTALLCLIYQKALTVKRNGNSSTTVGEIVNLMSVDCQRIQDAFTYSFYFITMILPIGIATVQLWTIMGVSSLGCLAVVILVLLSLAFIAIQKYKIQKELLHFKGIRIKILNEVISGIKVLKMYAWEPPFMKKIQSIRALEMKTLWKYTVLNTASMVMSVHSPFVMMFVLVLIYVLTSPNHSLGPEEAFTALAYVNIIKLQIIACPFLVNGAVQGLVSVKRIQDFLRSKDHDIDSVNKDSSKDCPILIENGEFTWNLDSLKPILKNININVQEGELVAVAGTVGSGKSSLLAACLGEIEKVKGSVTLNGNIAYIPQEAWIQNLSLRDNILFGKDFKDWKYQMVLDACALIPDLNVLPMGDMTEIGEKGINISGGQKQRVSLARAVYNNADVYLLDDPLSAVDSHVGNHLFKRVIGNTGILKKKTRILVTHGIHWLPMVDRIIVMSNGTIVDSGTYDELISRDGNFAKFLLQNGQQDDSDTGDRQVRQMKDNIREKIAERLSDSELTPDDDVVTVQQKQRRRPDRLKSKADVKSRQKFELSRLITEETKEEGAIKPVVLLTYMRAMGVCVVIFAFLSICIFQGLSVFSNFWLTLWTDDELLVNRTLSSTKEYTDLVSYYVVMYFIQGLAQGIVLFTGFYFALTRMVRASEKLHNKMLASILRSPMSFFDTTPVGRVINRFSSDVDIIDTKLPESIRLWTMMVSSTLAVLVVVTITTPIFIAAIIPISVFYAIVVNVYLPTSRLMQRTESVNRSPIYNHFSETITGASVIRAFRYGLKFVEESRRRINENSKFYYAALTGGSWIGTRLEIIGNVMAFLALVFALNSEELSGAQVGLSITYAIQLTVLLNFLIVAISEMEMNIVAVERVIEYTNLPVEAEWTLDGSKSENDWPQAGRIEFLNLKVRYREGLELILKGINCTIHEGEKVAIVGRTGAGKTTLTQSLLRLVEAAEGKILIDGVDISKLGLHYLRNKLTILPQDPIIYTGSLRTNLDPFGRYNDDNIWNALKCAHLKDFVQGVELGLDYDCGEGGQNLSVGQRQLLCLARTLLHKTRVLILDEATAAVDMETDQLIQDTIRNEFKECTIIAIAHRLNTIMDYDRVMLLDAGMIQEFDSPQRLIQNDQSAFYGMAKSAGLF